MDYTISSQTQPIDHKSFANIKIELQLIDSKKAKIQSDNNNITNRLLESDFVLPNTQTKVDTSKKKKDANP